MNPYLTTNGNTLIIFFSTKLYILFNQHSVISSVKFIYSEKATKFCEIFPSILTVCTVVKSKGNISQKFMAFSEYMNFNKTKATIPGVGMMVISDWAESGLIPFMIV